MKKIKYRHIIIDDYYIKDNILYFTTSSFSFPIIINLLKASECKYLRNKTVEVFYINHDNIPIKKFLKNRIDFILKYRDNAKIETIEEE